MGILPEMEYCMEIINPAAMPAHRAEWISSTMTSVALRRACRRLLPARERPSQAFPSQRESRQWLTGTKEFPSDQPRVSIRNPQRYFMEQWSKTLAGSSTFFERERSNRLSSTMKTSLRSSSVRGFMKPLMMSAESSVVKRCQFVRALLRKR